MYHLHTKFFAFGNTLDMTFIKANSLSVMMTLGRALSPITLRWTPSAHTKLLSLSTRQTNNLQEWHAISVCLIGAIHDQHTWECTQQVYRSRVCPKNISDSLVVFGYPMPLDIIILHQLSKQMLHLRSTSLLFPLLFSALYIEHLFASLHLICLLIERYS